MIIFLIEDIIADYFDYCDFYIGDDNADALASSMQARAASHLFYLRFIFMFSLKRQGYLLPRYQRLYHI